jgi:hypothetical protein
LWSFAVRDFIFAHKVTLPVIERESDICRNAGRVERSRKVGSQAHAAIAYAL